MIPVRERIADGAASNINQVQAQGKNSRQGNDGAIHKYS